MSQAGHEAQVSWPPTAVPRPHDGVTRARAALALNSLLAELTHSPAGLQQQAVEQVAELVGDAAALWLVDDGEIRLAAHHHPDPAARAQMRRLVAHAEHDSRAGFLAGVLRSGGTFRATGEQLVQFMPSMAPPYRAYFAEHGVVAMMLAPLTARGTTMGVLGVTRDAGAPQYTPSDEGFLHQVASVVAVAVDNSRLLAVAAAELAARTQAQDHARHLATHDALTDLPNRRALQARLEHAAASAEPTGLLLLDLDGFKHVNDAFGHEVGDRLLVAVAEVLQAALRGQGDERLLLCRLGGDEFAVHVPGDDAAWRAQQVAAAMLSALRPSLEVSGLHVDVDASIGLAVGPQDAFAPVQLLRLADIAMYRAKRTRSGLARYDAALDAAAGEQLEHVAELRRAMTEPQLDLHYQPLIPVRRDVGPPPPVLCFEALVRWRHPERGLLAPAEFLPLADEAGLLSRLTEIVTGAALKQLDAWHSGGTPVQVSVNIPAAALGDVTLPGRLLEQLDERGLPREALCLELTESVLAQPAALEALRTCSDAGIAVAIDDFGAGYSSLAYLAELPVRRLKVDSSFVRRLAGSPRRLRLLTGVVDIAHALGYEVVAEGVETAADADLVAATGVDLLQGFLHARPMPADDVPGWMRAHAGG